jgi:hypothetical protein
MALGSFNFSNEEKSNVANCKKRDFSVINEVRAARKKHAARFNYDLEKIFEDIIARQKSSGRKYVRYPAKRIDPAELVSVGEE